MSKRHLEIQLKKLQEGADTQYDAYRRSHDQLYELLAQSYLWWRDADKERGFLDALYEQRGIRFKASANNLPNFSPLIRLVWNMEEMDPSDWVTVTQWNKALQAVHEHYVQNADDFYFEAKGKLKRFIQDKGGVVGLISGSTEYANDDEPTHRSRRKSRSRINAQSQAAIAQSALTELKAQKQGIGSAAIRGTVRVGGEGLSVLLARREKNGHITVLGSSNDPIQIDAVAAHAVQTNLTNLAPNLRALVEIIATQAFPSHALPSSSDKRSKWYLTRYADKSEVWEGDLEGKPKEDRGERLRSAKRVLIRGKKGDVLLSGSRVSVSPVTRCVLNEPLIDKSDNVFLRVLERSKIEQWIETKEITLLNADPKHRLKSAARSERASYKLAITSAVQSGIKQFLHFYDHTPDKKITHYQADFQRDKFKADWSVRLSTEWFASLRQVWADEWFAELGRFNQILRPHNAALELKVTAKKLYVVFNLHPQNSPFETFEFPEPIKSLKRTLKTAYFSKDIAPILFNIADAHINGAVTMAGNAHAIVFRYATKVGKFEIAVPTLDAKRKHRDGTLFYALDRPQ
jgi:hypothetical protein